VFDSSLVLAEVLARCENRLIISIAEPNGVAAGFKRLKG